MTMDEPADIALALRSGIALIDRSDRARLEICGPDRVKFLHNLTTNDVKRLAAGRGQEAFVTSPQGKTLGYVTVLACDDHILIRADPHGLVGVLPHLNKYGVFDDVTITDVSPTTFEFHMVGPEAEAVVARAGGMVPPAGELSHVLSQIGSSDVRLVREAPTGRPGLTVIGALADATDVRSQLWLGDTASRVVHVGPELFDVLRIEAGTPVFGRDVTAENLPQEIGRDDRAISYVKGCYLGQETVARIDALGHVNKLLKGLRLRQPASHPIVGAGLELDGKKVGTVTSAAFSPGWGTTIALGYIRSAQAVAGTELIVVADGEGPRQAMVCDLPMIPTST